MSLTKHLADPHSPVRRFFEERLPNVAGLQERYRDGWDVTISPRGYRPTSGTIGIALDYRLRYYFGVTAPHEFTAAHSHAVVAVQTLVSVLPDDPYLESANYFIDEADIVLGLAFLRLSAGLLRVTDRLDPVGKRLNAEQEAELCRYCYVLALFEEVYRTGRVWPGSPLSSVTRSTDLRMLLGFANEDTIEDLCQMSWAFFDSQQPLLSRPAILNPTFRGSKDVGGADADIIVDRCLVDFKTTTGGSLRKATIYQLVGYAFLDYGNQYDIKDVALYLARRPALLRWPLHKLLGEMAGGPVDLTELRSELKDVVSTIPQESQQT